jgi:putative tricarboxylic transport membrane protein
MPAAAAEWTPQKDIEFVVGSSPGSGTDVTARMIQKITHDGNMLPVPITVVNKAGGGSAIAFSYLAQHPADPHYMVMGSYNLVTNQITGKSKLGIADFTDLAFLFNDYITFNVKAGSPIKDAHDLIARLKKNPQAVTFGVSSSVAGANHIAVALVAKAAGIDPKRLKIVVFSSGGKSATAVLGGHVDVQAVSASVAAKLAAAKGLRVLAVASPHRLGAELAGVPTWRELGVPVTATNWRVMFAPKGLKPAEVAYWDAFFKRVTDMPAWQEYLKHSFSDNAYRNSADTTKYLQEEYTQVRAILDEIGLAR